jgi:hypothetical protein
MSIFHEEIIKLITGLTTKVNKSLQKSKAYELENKTYQDKMRYVYKCYQTQQNAKNTNDNFLYLLHRAQELSMLTVKELVNLGEYKIKESLLKVEACPIASNDILNAVEFKVSDSLPFSQVGACPIASTAKLTQFELICQFISIRWERLTY